MRLGLRLADTIIDVLLVLFVLAVSGFGIYALWDNQNIYQGSDASVYEIYHPDAETVNGEDGLARLRAVNPDVIAWIEIDDTQIDYPVVQGVDNSRYVNTDAAGNYSLSGSIFLDYRSAADFSSPNSIFYGHNMAKGTMFGELDKYRESSFFDSHRTGALYHDSAWHRITFFAFLQGDAYDKVLYDPLMARCEGAEGFCAYLKSRAQYYEEPEISFGARFITLSTCRSSGAANGRYLLIGIIEEEEAEYSR